MDTTLHDVTTRSRLVAAGVLIALALVTALVLGIFGSGPVPVAGSGSEASATVTDQAGPRRGAHVGANAGPVGADDAGAGPRSGCYRPC